MGNEISHDDTSEIPQTGETSSLYWACRNGNQQLVNRILSTKKFYDINQLEPNGSTALHAAAFYGHAEIVHLLLHRYGVMRHRKNKYGLTAFQEASDHHIRQLFERPKNSRFCSHDNVNNLFDVFNADDEKNNMKAKKPSGGWVDGYTSNMDSYLSWRNIGRKIITNPVLQETLKTIWAVQFLTDNPEKMSIRHLQEIAHTNIPTNHQEFQKSQQLLSDFVKKKKPESLLHLYTLETPFYRSLDRMNSGALLFLILWRRKSLKNRTYRGRSFRGLTMTNNGLEAYRWALQRKGSLIRTSTFCSTSIEEHEARKFISVQPGTDKKKVLIIMDFPEACDTTIALYAISNELECISEYENEKEVLVLPTTIFKVTNIDQSSDLITIYLENMNEFSILKAFKK